MYDVRTKMGREILAELRKHFADKMFNTIVNFNTKIKEAASLGQPIDEYDPACKGQKDFRSLAEEIVGSQAELQRHEVVNSLASQLEAISVTADELLQAANPPILTIKAVQPPETGLLHHHLHADKLTPAKAEAEEHNIEPPEKPEPFNTDAKLSDYYGVNQMNDAVVFVTLYPRAGSVQVAGDFNNWQPTMTPMQKVGDTGVWQTKLKLPAGKYRYRLVVDGQWQQDPYNESTELNPFGDYNSIIEVN